VATPRRDFEFLEMYFLPLCGIYHTHSLRAFVSKIFNMDTGTRSKYRISSEMRGYWERCGLLCIWDICGHTKSRLRVFTDLFLASLQHLSYPYIASICFEDLQHGHQYEKQIQNFFQDAWFFEEITSSKIISLPALCCNACSAAAPVCSDP